MDIEADSFDDLTRRYAIDNELIAEFNKAEQWWHQQADETITSTDVVRRAWDNLPAGEQAKAMDILFNAFYHQTIAVRKWLEINDKEPDGNTYLHNGDLEVLDDTFNGAAMMGEDWDEAFPGGMVPIHVDVIRRIVSEVELLQHRLKIRAAGAQKSAEAGQ